MSQKSPDLEGVNDIRPASPDERRLLDYMFGVDIEHMGRDDDLRYIPLTKEMQRVSTVLQGGKSEDSLHG